MLDLYIAAIFARTHGLYMNKGLFMGAFIPLMLLSIYPLAAILSHWMISFTMRYMSIYPIIPTLIGLVLVMSIFDVRTEKAAANGQQ